MLRRCGGSASTTSPPSAHATLRVAHEAGEDVERRGLARAARAEQRHELARRRLERHAGEHLGCRRATTDRSSMVTATLTRSLPGRRSAAGAPARRPRAAARSRTPSRSCSTAAMAGDACSVDASHSCVGSVACPGGARKYASTASSKHSANASTKPMMTLRRDQRQLDAQHGARPRVAEARGGAAQRRVDAARGRRRRPPARPGRPARSGRARASTGSCRARGRRGRRRSPRPARAAASRAGRGTRVRSARAPRRRRRSPSAASVPQTVASTAPANAVISERTNAVTHRSSVTTSVNHSVE